MKRYIPLMIVAMLAAGACTDDESGDAGSPARHDAGLELAGRWYAPDMSWMLPVAGVAEEYSDMGSSLLTDLWNHPDTCGLVFHDDARLTMTRPAANPTTGSLFVTADYAYSLNDDSTQITLTADGQQSTVRMRIRSSYEIELDGVTYLKDEDNPTSDVAIPAGDWQYDFVDGNGVYWKGVGSNLLDLEHPIYSRRGANLYVDYEWLPQSAVRPAKDYATLAVRPHGCVVLCGGRAEREYELQTIEYNGITQMAYVQVSGGYNDAVKVGEYAFAGLREVRAAVLGATAIEAHAFEGCPLKAVYLYRLMSEDVFHLDPSAFDSYTYEHTPLHVPQNAELPRGWSRFKHVYYDLPSSMR